MSGASTNGHEVQLRIYDISLGVAAELSPMLLGKRIGGIWHTGVHVYGLEYFFGGGILSMPPEELERSYNMNPKRVLSLGFTQKTKSEFHKQLAEWTPKFTEKTYDLINWNCNHFTNECAKFLIAQEIPKEYLHQHDEVKNTPLGSMILTWLQTAQKGMQDQMSRVGSRSLFSAGSANPYLLSPSEESSSQSGAAGSSSRSNSRQRSASDSRHVQSGDGVPLNGGEGHACATGTNALLIDSIDSRDTEFRDALVEFAAAHGTHCVDGLLLLRKLSTNILTYPTNEKYRLVKKVNAGLTIFIALDPPQATALILMLGFKDTSETNFSFPSPKADTLQRLRQRNRILEQQIRLLDPSKLPAAPTDTPTRSTAPPPVAQQSPALPFANNTGTGNVPAVSPQLLSMFGQLMQNMPQNTGAGTGTNTAYNTGGGNRRADTAAEPEERTYSFQMEQLTAMGFTNSQECLRCVQL
eukprot:Lankesteria_metandrocarpae@DN1067_c0_g1_i1.p1